MNDLIRLIADLEAAGPKAQAASYTAMQVEGHRMKDDWRDIVSGARALPGLPGAVSYDLHVTGLRSLDLEVGYEHRGQGELGNLAEFGSSTEGPLRPAGQRVLNGGADRLEKYLLGLDPL